MTTRLRLVRAKALTAGLRRPSAVPAILAVVGLMLLLGSSASAAAPAKKHPTAPAKPRHVTFGIGPASATGLQDRSILNYQMDPGSQISDDVGVVNLDTRPLTINVYAVDATNDATGAIAYDPRARPGSGARTWITIAGAAGGGRVTLKPRQTAILPITIKVPTNATPGDHLAALIASVNARIAGKGRIGNGPTFEQRVALRAYLRISGTLRPALTIQHLHASYSGTLNPFGTGKVTTSYTVTNTGNVALGGAQAVKLTGLFGATGSMRAIAQVPLLLPGGSYPVRVTTTDVWPELFMHARVTITALAAPGDTNPVMAPFTAETTFLAIPWTLLVLIVVIIALVIGFIVWRRKHPDSGRHRGGDGGAKVPAMAGKG